MPRRYWHQRYCLFSRFDAVAEALPAAGADAELWLSVTPEEVARAFLLGALRDDGAHGDFSHHGGDLEQFVDLLVEPHLFTYRHAREVLGAGVGEVAAV